MLECTDKEKIQSVSNHHIEDYHFGEITIDGKKYRKDLVVLPDRIIDNWWRDRGHLLEIKDLDPVMQDKPEVLVIGQGAYSRLRVPDEIRSSLEHLGIELYTLPTPEACEKYNQLSQKRPTAAALHLTC